MSSSYTVNRSYLLLNELLSQDFQRTLKNTQGCVGTRLLTVHMQTNLCETNFVDQWSHAACIHHLLLRIAAFHVHKTQHSACM